MTEGDIKEVVRIAVEEVIQQMKIDFDKVDYLVGVLGGSIKLVKNREDIVNKRIAPAKKVDDDVIKAEYEKGLTYKEIADSHNMTIDGVYKRVKAMGIYQPRRQ
ncbi:MAG: hypothetical protein K0S47_2411 [Herbinix sp.]|jgi:hypothetical protein|nr:hypothetical protein [Herbinix sp.]